MKWLLLILCTLASCSVNDDIRFISPRKNEFVSGTLTIKILPPASDNEAGVWVEKKNGASRPMWAGMLNKDNNFTVILDVSEYDKGAYGIEYYVGLEDYNMRVDFWIE